MAKYSVIVPVYNNETYVDRCVTSVVEQTYESWELILVDDGSTDASGVLCDTYHNTHPDKIRVVHQENAGVLYARRAGMERATGEYLCFLDSDDYWDSSFLGEIDEYVEEYNPDMIRFGYRSVDRFGNVIAEYIPVQNIQYIERPHFQNVYTQLMQGVFSSLCTGIVRKDLLDLEGDYSQYQRVFKGEDFLQNLAFVDNASSVLFVPKSYYNYLQNQESLSNRKITESYLHSHLLVQDRVMEYFEKWGIEEQAGCQMFLGVFKAAMRALMSDSIKNPRYSKDEVLWMLDYLTSPPYTRYLDNIQISGSDLPSYLVRLLQKGRIRTLRFSLFWLRRVRAIYVVMIKPLTRRERRVSGVSNK